MHTCEKKCGERERERERERASESERERHVILVPCIRERHVKFRS
jgi:hypothetical protein